MLASNRRGCRVNNGRRTRCVQEVHDDVRRQERFDVMKDRMRRRLEERNKK